MGLNELRGLYEVKRYDEVKRTYDGGAWSAEGHLIGSLAHWHLGAYSLSRWAAELGLSLAQDEGSLTVKLHHQVGMCAQRLGDWQVAEFSFNRVLEMLSDVPELRLVLKGITLYNLASVFADRKNEPAMLRQALTLYRQAASEFKHEGMHDHLRMCLQNVAWLACDLDDAATAATALDESAPLCTTHAAMCHQRVGYAYLHLTNDEEEAAGKVVVPLLDDPELPNDVRVLALSLVVLYRLGMWGDDSGALMVTKGTAESACTLAAKVGDSRCWTVAKRALERVMNLYRQNRAGA
jgi:tetratricopeptide (TPR) repeat protein